MLTEKKEKKEKDLLQRCEKASQKKPKWRDTKRNAKCNFMTTMRRFAEVRFIAVFFMENALIVYTVQNRLFKYTENTQKMAPSPI